MKRKLFDEFELYLKSLLLIVCKSNVDTESERFNNVILVWELFSLGSAAHKRVI